MEGSSVALAFSRHQLSVTVDIETGAALDPDEERYLARVGADAARVAVAEALDRAGVPAAVMGLAGVNQMTTPERPEGSPEGCGPRGSEAVA